MATISVSTNVAAPIDQVFKVYTEIEKAAERIPDITALEVLSEGPFGEGTRWRETRVIMKKEATEEMWVTDVDPPNSYTVASESHGMKYSTLFSFTPEGDGTRVSWNANFQMKGGARLFQPFLRGVFEKLSTEAMEGLKSTLGP